MGSVDREERIEKLERELKEVTAKLNLLLAWLDEEHPESIFKRQVAVLVATPTIAPPRGDRDV